MWKTSVSFPYSMNDEETASPSSEDGIYLPLADDTDNHSVDDDNLLREHQEDSFPCLHFKVLGWKGNSQAAGIMVRRTGDRVWLRKTVLISMYLLQHVTEIADKYLAASIFQPCKWLWILESSTRQLTCELSRVTSTYTWYKSC